MLTTDQKGIVAETKIAAVALAEGIGVARQLGDERYDLVFDVGDRFLKMSVQPNCPSDARRFNFVWRRLSTTNPSA